MSAKTKIVVLKSKELIYTAIFVILGIALISLLIYMFSPSKNKKATDTSDSQQITDSPDKNNTIISNDNISTTENITDNRAPEATIIPPEETITTINSTDTYKSGVYSSIMNVGGQTELQLAVTVDNGAVSHIDITNLNETVTVMYPLIGSSLDEINAQLESGTAFENLTYSKDNQYTSILIIQAAKEAITR